MPSNITAVITSCNRHDLLHNTLESLSKFTDVEFAETILIEDSGLERPHWFVPRPQLQNLGKLTFLNNGCRKGQVYSIDRAYTQVTTPYIFHCEDDWESIRGGFIKPSLEILEKFPQVIQVNLRDDWNHPLISDSRFPFKIAEPGWRGGWGGLSWNPGLRRLQDWKRIGSFGAQIGYAPQPGCGLELKLSQLYLGLGFVIASLPQGCVVHTGGSRSVCIRPVEDIPVPKVLIAVPACHQFEYGRWESADSPHYNPQHEAYGKDIHISGANPRIAALRDTWWKDIAAHPNVTGKFLYGTPHKREPLPDEVFLDIPDDYGSLTLKTQSICRYAIREGYDYLFKCDDDTAVYVDRLIAELLSLYPSNKVPYAGWENGNVCTGGPGYWLSRKAMEAVANAGTPDHWAEDCWVAKVMGRHNWRSFMLPNHRPGFSAHWFFNEGFDPKKLTPHTVTMHAVQPEMMREWYAHERGTHAK